MNVVGVDYWVYHRRHHLNHSAAAVHVFARPLFRNQYCFNNNQINCKFIDFDCELIEMCIYASFRSLTQPICTYLAAGLLAVLPAGLATINRHYPRAPASNSDPSRHQPKLLLLKHKRGKQSARRIRRSAFPAAIHIIGNKC